MKATILWSVMVAGACGTTAPARDAGPGAQLVELATAAPTDTPTAPAASDRSGTHLVPRAAETVPEAARAEARELNREGLRAHARSDFTTARGRFEAAGERDPSLGHAWFNAACAAARLGDVDGARAHAATFLRLEPGSAGRLLHDEDLTGLRASAGFDAWLRATVRPTGEDPILLRSIVFERRRDGGDLFVIAEDGLDERPLAADSEWREHRAAVTADGERVVHLASRFGDAVPPRRMGRGHPRRDWEDVAQQGRLYDHRFDHELRSVPFEGGETRVLGRRVHSYRLDRDGQTVLYLDEPTDGAFRVRAVPADGAEADAVTLAVVPMASTWCYARRADGSLVVAEGTTHRWASGLTVRVVEHRDGVERELVARRDLRAGDPRVPDFQLCVLSEDETELHLGLLRVPLAGSARIAAVPELSLGNGAYNFRHVGSRGDVGSDELYLTVVGETHEDESYEAEPFESWQTSPLSWVNDNGMGPPWWYETRVVAIDWRGATRRFLSPERRSFDYGPAVRPDGGAVALTRFVPGGEPWVVITDPDGEAARRIVAGQYPVWTPVPAVH